jgi:hypothetical protein
MSTQASGPYLVRRVAARAGVGVWRHRGGVLVAAVVALGLGGYVAMSGTDDLAGSFAAASPSATSDCADTAMAVIADKSPSAAQRAYQCMDASFQQRVTEQAFVQQMQTQKMPDVQKLARVGDYHTPAGGTMVYYAIDGPSQSVGYIVYLGQNGKVTKIE